MAVPSPIFLGGPTASGKTAVAIELARLLPEDGEIVNADAFQLYSGLRIVTARPTAEEVTACPHHLFGILDPSETCHAERYRQMAQPVIDAIASRGPHPIVVGGSGLYLKALTHGLPPVPPADEDLRAELAALSAEERVARLREVDPTGAEAMDLCNDRYVTRALEISLLAGRPGSEIKAEWAAREVDVDAFALVWERDALVERIERRAALMLEGGALEEVAALPELSSTAEKAIGVAEIRRHLAGEISLEECREELVVATRRYAKRQRTWFRRETCFVPVEVGASGTPQAVASRIAAMLGSRT